MFDKARLHRDIDSARTDQVEAPDLLHRLLREQGLRFVVDAGERSADEVAAAAHRLHPDFAVEALVPDADWARSLYSVSLAGVTFDDLRETPWDLAHALRKVGAFPRVAPEIPVVIPPAPEPQSSGFDASTDDGPEWANESLRIAQAWAEIEATGRAPGQGVVIGHPDTGWVDHEVWDAGGLDKDHAYNSMTGKPGAEDPLVERFEGHGTHTASVMVAPRGGTIEGVAPGAKVLPIRAVTTPLLYPGQRDVLRAVDYAVAQGCQVISMSLGGVGQRWTLGVGVWNAVEHDVIVIAASGNYVGITAQPARYWWCLGVGGAEPGDEEWGGAAWWPAGTVSISAPAASVWKATADKHQRDGYDASNGTSYATALTAGIAAMWLSHHFPNGYSGAQKALYRFRDHIDRTKRVPPGWGPGLVGIVDAGELMTTEPEDKLLSDPQQPDFSASADVTERSGSDAWTQMLGIIDAEELEAWACELADLMQREPILDEIPLALASAALTRRIEIASEAEIWAASDGGESQPLRVVSRNLYLGADILDLFPSGDQPPLGTIVQRFYEAVQRTRWADRVERLAEEIIARRPQVVCLQEVFRYELGDRSDLDFASSLLAQLSQRGGDYQVAAIARASDLSLPIDGDGTLRLVDHELILVSDAVRILEAGDRAYADSLTLDLPNAEHDERRSVTFRRAFAWARIALDGRVVTVVNTQLERSAHAAIQQAQARELVDSLLTVEGELLVVGDLDVEPCSSPQSTWQILIGIGLHDSFPSRAAATCCEDPLLDNETSAHDRRIDHVLLRGSLRVHATETFGHRPDERTSQSPRLWPSDHAGIMVTLS